MPADSAMPPDELLLERSREGDRAAREELFRRHFAMAQRVAIRLLGQEQDALDAVQDAFLKAVLHLDEFDGRSQFRTWLMRIVTNSALDAGRKRKRHSSQALDVGNRDGAIEPSTEDDPSGGLHREDLRRLLNQALEKLNPALRATFVLFAEAELSYKEIAELQNVPVGTIMSRLHYARLKLQGWMDEAGMGLGRKPTLAGTSGANGRASRATMPPTTDGKSSNLSQPLVSP